MGMVWPSFLVKGVEKLENPHPGVTLPKQRVMLELWNKRWSFKGYLLCCPDKKNPQDAYRLDCVHFVSAAATAYTKIDFQGMKVGGSPDKALGLGIANELVQLLTGSNSAFHEEDFFSNRYGSMFGPMVGRSPFSVHVTLDKFLKNVLRATAPDDSKVTIKEHGAGDIAGELLSQLVDITK